MVFFGLEYAWNIPGEPGCHSSLVIVCSVCPDNAGFSLSPCWSVSWDFPKILLTGRTGGRTPGIQSDQPDPWRKRRQHQHQAPPTPSAHRHSQSRFFFLLSFFVSLVSSLLIHPSSSCTSSTHSTTWKSKGRQRKTFVGGLAPACVTHLVYRRPAAVQSR